MACFEYVWKIANFSFCVSQRNQDLPSPSFKAGNLKWKLLLCSEAGTKSELFRLVLKCNGESTDAQLDCELSFLASDGTVLRSQKVEGVIVSEVLSCICADFIPRTAIFGSKIDLFLPLDTLTVRCRIWKNGIEPRQCLAQTTFHRKNLLWNVKRFNITLHHFTTTTSFQLASRHFDINLTKSLLTENGFSNVEITKTKGEDIFWAKCKICVLSVDGKERANLHDYDSPPNTLKNPWRFPIILKEEDITNFTLSLQWEFTVGATEISHVDSQSVSKESTVLQTKNNPALSSTLQKDLLGSYRDQKLCDATLKTGDAYFLVHKSVLGARSSEFCAIFEKETEECQTSVVDIADVDQNTLERMILFLYTDSLENIHWEEASKLYYAADKYAIHPLKAKCLPVLKAELSVFNVCDAVLLAHTHQEKDLMQFAQEFICEHNEIIFSQEWSCLENSHPQLIIKLLRAITFNLKKEQN